MNRLALMSSASSLKKRIARLEDVVAGILWKQWRSVGGSASAMPAKSLVDPEALVLASIWMGQRERRFTDVLYGWMEENAALLSVQRLRNLERSYPPEIHPSVREFAYAAKALAKHPRWAALSKGSQDMWMEVDLPDVRRAVRAPLHSAPSMLLRFRMAFGVGTKSDVLVAALCHRSPVTVRRIAAVTGYTAVAVRTALVDLTRAGFLHVLDRRPATFRAPQEAWLRLLRQRYVPDWIPWHDFFSFVAELNLWMSKTSSRSVSEYALTVKFREAMLEHGRFLEYAPIAEPEVSPSELPTYFGSYVDVLTEWATHVA